MSSIGGGSRIVGPQGPAGPPTVGADGDAGHKGGADPNKTPSKETGDAFDRSAAASKRPSELASPLKLESEQRFNDLLRQMRGDPKALLTLTQALNASLGRYNGEFTLDKAKLTPLLDRLVDGNFSQGALDAVRAELNQLREKMAAARQRMAIQKRRLRGLKQLVGRVSDSRLAEEIAHIEADLKLAGSNWAETLVGLNLGRALYGGDDETPAHLRKVIKAPGRRGHESEAFGDTLSELHPGRVVVGLAVREIEGRKEPITKRVLDQASEPFKFSNNRTMQAFVALYELFERPDEE